jgi:GDSL-like Lipase/Acylhydrolase family
MMIRWLLLTLLLVSHARTGLGQQVAPTDAARVVREEIEWLDVWVPGNSNTTLPRVLLIGDSIARGYYGGVEAALQGQAVVARLTTSKSLGDPGLLGEVKLILSQTKFDVVHFNNGLHGWGYTEQEYAAAFPELVEAIRAGAPGARLIWATTTPMRVPGQAAFQPENERVVARNAIAARLTAQEKIPTDDLYGVLADKPELWSGDGVHLNGDGTAVLGAKAAEAIRALLRTAP